MVMSKIETQSRNRTSRRAKFQNKTLKKFVKVFSRFWKKKNEGAHESHENQLKLDRIHEARLSIDKSIF